MKTEIKELLKIPDPKEMREKAEELVAKGVLARFEVQNENQFYYNPQDTAGTKAAVRAIDSLEKFKAGKNFATLAGNSNEAETWQEAIERLHKMFPKLAHFEELYDQRIEKMRKGRS